MLGIRHQLLRRFGNINCVLLGTHPSYGMDELSDKSIQLSDKSKQSLIDRVFHVCTLLLGSRLAGPILGSH
jgi:hypothetical protein